MTVQLSKISLRANRQSAIGNRQFLIWHGWRLELPARWNPVKLEGDASAGFILVADMHRERLGFRWATPGKKTFDAAAWADAELRQEVGQLAAEEAKAFELPEDRADGRAWAGSKLYIEPEPPGRDVWAGHSEVSNRSVVVVHHARRRERILPDVLLPAVSDLNDAGRTEPMPWSVFELSCEVPAEFTLDAQVLNAGDLNLSFVGRADKRKVITVRQLSIAEVALARQPLDKWLRQHQNRRRKHYRIADVLPDVTVTRDDGQPLKGLMGHMVRRRRFCLKRSLPREFVTLALHDEGRDRIVIVQATDEASARSVAATVGWAHPADARQDAKRNETEPVVG